MPPRDRRRRPAVDASSPVFLDRTGRRRRLMVTVGAVLAAGLLASVAVLLAGLFTGGPMPLPGWPEPDRPGGAGMGVGRLGAPATSAPVRPVDRRETTPSSTRTLAPPTRSATPSASPADRPGRSDERRASPNPRRGKPSQPPGKPG